MVVLNPAPHRFLSDATLAACDVLIPNEGEARELAGCSEGEDLETVAKVLAARTGGHIVITCGGDGVLVREKNGEVWTLAAHKVDVLDTIGAGDTFCGYLCAELAAGRSLRQSIEIANRASAIAVTRPGGAQAVPMRSELEEDSP